MVTSVASKEVLERWTFDIQTDKAVVSGRWVLLEAGLGAGGCCSRDPGRLGGQVGADPGRPGGRWVLYQERPRGQAK